MSGGRAARAAVALVAAAALALTTTRGLVAEGNRALKAGKPDEAVKAYQRALERAPGRPEILFDLGVAEAQAGDPAGGRDHLHAALTAGGESLRGAVEYNVGNTYLTEQKWADAAGAFEAALRADPTNRDAKANLELARRKLKEEQEKQKEEERQKDQQGDQKKGEPGDEGEKGDKEPSEEQEKQGAQDDKGKKKPDEGQASDQGAKEKQPPPGQEEGEKTQGGAQPEQAGAEGGAPEPRPAPAAPQPDGGGGGEAGAMDPAQATQLLDDLQRRDGDVQRQVRARLVPVAPRQRAQDW